MNGSILTWSTQSLETIVSDFCRFALQTIYSLRSKWGVGRVGRWVENILRRTLNTSSIIRDNRSTFAAQYQKSVYETA